MCFSDIKWISQNSALKKKKKKNLKHSGSMCSS